MRELAFDDLCRSLERSAHTGGATARVRVVDAPNPFVPPTLVWEGSDVADPFAAEVLFVVASAAVGKSTLARQLSAVRQIPLLNLADVPVSTGSLKSLISDLRGSTDPLEAFHAGRLPVIVDALDEGRLLSGEKGFESFLKTTGEFLLQKRSVTDRPKIVILGRHESIADAEVGLYLGGDGIVARKVRVGSFDEPSARCLINAYARAGCAPAAAYFSNPQPVAELVSAYFRAIESALGLNINSLWSDERGRMFAGYAPVLAALGSLLARIDNFLQVTTRLKSKGASEAWAVIGTVLDEILARERGKFCDQLAKRISVPVPGEAYDERDQLDFLVAHIHGNPIKGSARLKLPPNDLQTYFGMAEQMVAEHPFVHARRPSNAVLGSVILAHAIKHGLLESQASPFLPELSRQPFLWRSVSQQNASSPPLIDGAVVGFVLNSYWNDDIPQNQRVAIRSSADANEPVMLEFRHSGSGECVLYAYEPICLYAQARGCDVDVAGTLKFVGQGGADTSSVFMLHGDSQCVSSTLEVDADAVVLDGDLWIEADHVVTPSRLKLYRKENCRPGWGGQISKLFPWNLIESTLASPHGQAGGDVVARLVQECQRRLPANGVLTLTPGFGVPEDIRMRWINRDFASSFPAFMKMMLDAGLVVVDNEVSAHGQRKVRVHLRVAWADVLRAVQDPTWHPRLQEFLCQARNALNAGDPANLALPEPRPGETRFYKKIGEGGSHDIMRLVQDCGCNKWQGAHKADKAKKGIIKLENGRGDWSSMQHCASCTGGGMWKVRW